MSVAAIEERLSRYDLDPLTAYALGLGALLVGLAAAWIAADVLPRWLTLPVVTLGVGYWLVVPIDDTDRLARWLYALAGLVAVAPVVLILPALRRSGDLGVGWGTLLFAEHVLLTFAVFWVVAAVVAALGWRVARR